MNNDVRCKDKQNNMTNYSKIYPYPYQRQQQYTLARGLHKRTFIGQYMVYNKHDHTHRHSLKLKSSHDK